MRRLEPQPQNPCLAARHVGPLIGGFIAAFAHIRWVFAWTGVLTVLASLWAWWAIKDSHPHET